MSKRDSRSTYRNSSERQIEAIYAEIPSIPDCTGACSTACGPIYMFRAEWKRVTRSLGRTPRGLKGRVTCPMLNQNGQCMVYSVRPYICRLWGTTPDLKCPQGCEPERWLSIEEARDIMGRLMAITGPQTDGPLGPIDDLWKGFALEERAARTALIEAIRERRAADGG